MDSKALIVVSIVGVAVVHFVSSFFLAFAAGISAPSESPVLRAVAAVLTFPLSFLPDNLPEAVGWLPWVALSLCWGVAITFGMRALLGIAK